MSYSRVCSLACPLGGRPQPTRGEKGVLAERLGEYIVHSGWRVAGDQGFGGRIPDAVGHRRAKEVKIRMGEEWTVGTCVNCSGPDVTVKSPLFCSERCMQAASLVRYVRRCKRDGRDQRADVQEAIQMRMAHILGGGYPVEERAVPPQIRAEIFQRARNRCELCGRALDMHGTGGDLDAQAQIHHVAGSSSDPGNLRAVCRRCNMADSQSKFRPTLPGSPEAVLAKELEARWSSPTPLRPCDDEERWKDQWPALKRQAQEELEMRSDLRNEAGAGLPTADRMIVFDERWDVAEERTQEDNFYESDYFRELMERDD